MLECPTCRSNNLKMQHYEAVEALHEILPLIKSEGSAEKALLKYANEHRLATTQLTKLAHVFNTARTHAFLDRNPDNRGGSFPIVDTEKLSADYEAMPESSDGEVSFKIAARKTAPDFFKMASTEATVKSAEEKKDVPVDPAYAEADAREKARIAKAKKEGEVIESDEAFQIVSDEKNEAKKAFDTLVDGLKSADFKDFEEDVMMHGYTGAKHKTVLDELAQACGGYFGCEKIARCSAISPARKLAYDRTNLLPTFEKIMTHLQNAEDAENYAKAVKRASTSGKDIDEDLHTEETAVETALKVTARRAAAENNQVDETPGQDEGAARHSGGGTPPQTPHGTQPGGGGGGSTHSNPPNLAAKADYTNLLKQTLDHSQSGDKTDKGGDKGTDHLDNAAKQISEILKTIPTGGEMRGHMFGKPDESKGSLTSLLAAQAPNHRQRHVDNKVMDTRGMANLQKLIMTDPILREADPDHVVDMYNDLRNAKPDLAHSPQQMAFALREALQYGGVPASTAKTLVDIDKAHQQADESRRKNTDALYSAPYNS